MNATTEEITERPVNVEEQARIVMAVLREYADKLRTLTRELSTCFGEWLAPMPGGEYNQAAWLLDQSELIRKPLLAMLSRGSGLRENAPLESITRDELNLRMVETEVHLHHMIRLTGDLRSLIERKKHTETVAKLRLAAGLSGMKGGPLRPE